MKPLRLCFLIFQFLAIGTVHPQAIDSVLGYYPMHIGDRWVYSISGEFIPLRNFYTAITGDTLMGNGHRYFVALTYNKQLKTSTIAFQRIDLSTACVFQWNDTLPELLMDSLDAQPADQWMMGSTWRKHSAIVRDTILGYPTVSRSNYGVMGSPVDKISYGLGLVQEDFDDTQSMNWHIVLLFAHINGIDYGMPLSVTSTHLSPEAFSLDQNYPNPFNPSTTIRFNVPAGSRVRLSVFNLLGQRIADLANEEMATGSYERSWNANVASGIYFYRIEAVAANNAKERFVDVKKMVLLK